MNVTEKVSSGMGGAFKKTTSVLKNIEAANDAHHANESLQDAKAAKEGNVRSGLYNAVESAGDAIMDLTNYATLGLARKVGNLIDDKDSKINYKALKSAKKSKVITDNSSIKDRAKLLLNDSISNQIVDAPSESKNDTSETKVSNRETDLIDEKDDDNELDEPSL